MKFLTDRIHILNIPTKTELRKIFHKKKPSLDILIWAMLEKPECRKREFWNYLTLFRPLYEQVDWLKESIQLSKCKPLRYNENRKVYR